MCVCVCVCVCVRVCVCVVCLSSLLCGQNCVLGDAKSLKTELDQYCQDIDDILMRIKREIKFKKSKSRKDDGCFKCISQFCPCVPKPMSSVTA